MVEYVCVIMRSSGVEPVYLDSEAAIKKRVFGAVSCVNA